MAPMPTNTYETNTTNDNLVFEVGSHHAYMEAVSSRYKQLEPPEMVAATVRETRTVRIQESADLVSDSPKFVWPTATTKITQQYFRGHSGIDISNSQKVEVYAAADGVAEFVGWHSGYGNTVIIDHMNGYKTLYGHLSRFTVSQGDAVMQHQVIGFQGNTGTVYGRTGIHLHFEVIRDGVKLNPLHFIR